MTNKFDKVNYSEFEPDEAQQILVDYYVEGRPWLLISVFPSQDSDIGLRIEAGGGMTVDLIEPLLEKALAGFKQGQESIKGE